MAAWPTATTQWEKRNIAYEVPVWDPAVCIQCMKCSMHCPHATIRGKIFDPSLLSNAPPTFQSVPLRSKGFGEKQFTIQVAAEDCTGCGLCVVVCPAKNKENPRRKAINMEPQAPLREQQRENYDFFLNLPDFDRSTVDKIDVKTSQYVTPLFEYSGACAGCGETPYVRLLTQLYGDRLLIANATGCSSIYGGNLPTCPYTTDREGRGPAWANSLFEDNAEFGLGFRLAVDAQRSQAERHPEEFWAGAGGRTRRGLTNPSQESDKEIAEQRARLRELKARLKTIDRQEARRLEMLADYLVPKSVWIIGGDGWAYDIGYGGLDHVLSTKRQREHPCARHRGLFQYRGTGIKGHASRRFSQVCGPRKRREQEGSWPYGHELWPCLCGKRGPRRPGRTHLEGLSGGRLVPGPVAHHRLQPLYRPGLRPQAGSATAETRGGLRSLAALPL